MEKDIELEVGWTYIFNRPLHMKPEPFKGMVQEVTEKTYLIQNLDSGGHVRLLKDDFDSDMWVVLETTMETELNNI